MRARADASARGRPLICAPVASALYSRVRLMANGYDEIAGIASVSLKPSEGLFDLVVQDGLNRADTARTLRAARLTAAPTLDTKGAVDIETDGESAGVLPATFEIYPVAINLRI